MNAIESHVSLITEAKCEASLPRSRPSDTRCSAETGNSVGTTESSGGSDGAPRRPVHLSISSRPRAGMIYLAHTAHLQFLGLVFGFLAWLFIMTAIGINEWRLWYVDDVSVVTSGVAWVGIWRACFYSHLLPDAENCRSIGISDGFVPPEIPLAQVLMMLAVVSGLLGNIVAAVAMRIAYFSVDNRKNMRLGFFLAGALYLVTAVITLVPLVWNMTSVLNNSTIDFPPEFNLPVAPVQQSVGAAIGVGIFASVLMLLSAGIFFCYSHSPTSLEQTTDPLDGAWTITTLPKKSNGDSQGMDNLGSYSEDTL